MTRSRQELATVITLLRHAIARRFGETIEAAAIEPGQSWEAVVSIASAHSVLPVLHEGICAIGPQAVPPDAAEFLEQIHRANCARNATMRQALLQVSRALNTIGVEPVVLKGGAFLTYEPISCGVLRFMGDLDLLVPADRLLDCVRLTVGLGYVQAPAEYAGTEHHYPALISPCGKFAFELHTRLFKPAQQPVSVAEVVRDADRLVLEGDVRLGRPSVHHRMVHGLAHLGLNHDSYLRRRIFLRDLTDLSVHLRLAGGEVSWPQLFSHFADQRSRVGAKGLVAAWRRLMREPVADLALDWQDRLWVSLAIAGLEGRRWRNVLMLPADLRLILQDPAASSRVRTALASPAKMYDWVVRRQRREQGQLQPPKDPA